MVIRLAPAPPSRLGLPLRAEHSAPRSAAGAVAPVQRAASARGAPRYPGNDAWKGCKLRAGNMNQSILELDAIATAAETRPLAVHEQPRQRMENFGVAALSDTELLATLLQGSGVTVMEAVTAASQLLAAAGSLTALASWQPADFRRVKRIGYSKGQQLAAVAEIGRRMNRPCQAIQRCNDPQQVAEMIRPLMLGVSVEKFYVLCLNRKNCLVKLVEISSGTATQTYAHPREVYREAIRYGSTAIIAAHTHPSSLDPTPSAADVTVTRQLREASRAIDIELIDHVIVGRPECDPRGVGHYSFRQAGIL